MAADAWNKSRAAIVSRTPIAGPNILTAHTTRGVINEALPMARGRPGTSTTTGMMLRGDWSPDIAYVAQSVVRLTGVGMFVALQAVPEGVSPTTGAPYWFFWYNPPPGVWSL